MLLLVPFFCPLVFSLPAQASFVFVTLLEAILYLSCTCSCIQFGSMFSLSGSFSTTIVAYEHPLGVCQPVLLLKYCKLVHVPYLVLTFGSFVPPLLAPMP
jgi:hypothetical protein